MRTHAVTKAISVRVCMHLHAHNEHYCHISELLQTSMLRVPIKEMLTSPARLLAVVISTYGMERDVNKIA